MSMTKIEAMDETIREWQKIRSSVWNLYSLYLEHDLNQYHPFMTQPFYASYNIVPMSFEDWAQQIDRHIGDWEFRRRKISSARDFKQMTKRIKITD